jgi:O-antigen ligase
MAKTIVLFGLASLIVLSPLAVGSVYVVTYSAVELIVFALAFVYICTRHDRSPAKHPEQRGGRAPATLAESPADSRLSVEEEQRLKGGGRREDYVGLFCVSLPLLLFLIVVLAQMIPFPSYIVRVVSPRTYAIYDRLGLVQGIGPSSASSLPFTLSLERTSGAFLKWSAYVCSFLLVAFYSPSRAFKWKRKWLTVLVVSLFVIGFAEAGYAFYLQSSSPEMLLWFNRTLDIGERLQGTYINADHFAGLMNLAAPLSAGFLIYLAVSYRIRRSTLKATILDLAVSRQGLAIYTLLVGFIVMMLALIFSGSRGAQVGFCFGIVFLTFLFLTRGRGHRERRTRSRLLTVSAICLCLCLGLVFAAARGLEPVVSRWDNARTDILRGRLFMWKATTNMVHDFPLIGTGFGTFDLAFPPYHPEELRTSYYDHAHNDYLEILSEVGLIGFVPLVSFLFLYLFFVIKGWLRNDSSFAVCVGAGGIISVIAASVHSLADFNLQIPANAFVLFTVMAVTWRAVHSTGKRNIAKDDRYKPYPEAASV